METFEYFGCTYSINDDKETVSLIDATQVKGKFHIPSQVEYNGKSYLVTGLQERVDDIYEWIEDRRRKEGGFYKKTERKQTSGPFQIPSRDCRGHGYCTGGWNPMGKVTSVIIPDSVKNLCEKAFDDCTKMEEIHLPKYITKIPRYCFCWCSSLKHIELHEGITAIEDFAFCICKLTEIKIPSTVETIGRFAFQGCSALTEITIPSSVKTIDEGAFGDCQWKDIVPPKCGLEVVNILNEEGAVIIHPKAFTDRVKINYLGKKKAAKAATPKTEKATSKTEKKEPVEKITSPQKTKTETKPTAQPTGDYKKSAVSGGYTIGITAENKVVVSKGGAVCDNAKGALREISEKVGFKFETSWTTQQFGSKLVDFINNK
jgi:hypothetical protein